MILQVAVAQVLLTGAGLAIRSFWRLQSIDPGFHTDNLITFQMALPETRYPRNTQVGAFYEAVLARLWAVPDVQSAELASHLPLALFGLNFAVTIEGRAAAQLQELPTADSLSCEWTKGVGKSTL